MNLLNVRVAAGPRQVPKDLLRLAEALIRDFHFGLPGRVQYTPSRHPLIMRLAGCPTRRFYVWVFLEKALPGAGCPTRRFYVWVFLEKALPGAGCPTRRSYVWVFLEKVLPGAPHVAPTCGSFWRRFCRVPLDKSEGVVKAQDS